MIDENKLIECIKEYHSTLKPTYISKLVDAEIEDILDIINEQPKFNQWIPCSYGLPKDGVRVLITYLGFYDNKPYCDGDAYLMNGSWLWAEDDDIVKVKVTAWRPLPEPYEGNE